MGFFIAVFFLYTFINAYIFHKGWKVLPASPVSQRILYGIVYFFFYSSFILAMLGRNHLPLEIQKALYLPGTVWLGAMLYLTLWFFVTDAVCFLFRLIPSLKKRKKSLRWRRIQVCVGYIAVVLVLICGYYRFTHPAVVEQTIQIRKSGGKYRSLKIAAFSDIHLGVAIDKKRLQRYVELINRQHPDLILIGGDVIDNNVLPLRLENMQEELNRLQAPLGVYMCLGNHEYLSGITSGLDFLKKTSIQLLIDRAISIDNSFWIIGRDDTHGNPHRKTLETLAAQTNPSQPLILLDHEPWVPQEAVENRIDLQFSGHTHFGQMWPLNYIVKQVFTIGYGYRKIDDTHLYVSSGLGLWGPPFRIGTQSEIVVFDLRFDQ